MASSHTEEVEDSLSSSVQKAISSSETAKLFEKRQHVLQEIRVTEESYLNDLEVLATAYIEPLQQRLQASLQSLTPMENKRFGKRAASTLLAGAGRSDSSSASGSSLFTDFSDPLAFIKNPNVAVMFKNVQQLRKINLRLFRKLQSRINIEESSPEHDEDPIEEENLEEEKENEIPGAAVIGDVFVNYAPLFKLYCEYAKGYDQVVNLLKDFIAIAESMNSTSGRSRGRRGMLSTSPPPSNDNSASPEQFNFIHFLNSVQKSDKCEGKPLQSYLILPVQRVPRYELLLQSLLKYTPEDHPDSQWLPQAISEVHKAAVYVETQLMNAENRKKLREIEENFGGSLNLIDTVPRREELRKIFISGTIKCGRFSKNKKEEDLHVYLFDDFLVLSNVSGEKHKMVDQISLTDCSLDVNVSASKLSKYKFNEILSFSIVSESGGIYIFEAQNEALKKDWCEKITANIIREKKLQSLKMFKGKESSTSSKSTEMSAEEIIINEVKNRIRKSDLRQLKERFKVDIPILRDKDPNVISARRFLVKEGLFDVQRQQNNSSQITNGKFHLHLLSDHLLVSKSIPGSTRQYGSFSRSPSISLSGSPSPNGRQTALSTSMSATIGPSEGSRIKKGHDRQASESFSRPSLPFSRNSLSPQRPVETDLLELIELIPLEDITFFPDSQSLPAEAKNASSSLVAKEHLNLGSSKSQYRILFPIKTEKTDWLSHIQTGILKLKEEKLDGKASGTDSKTCGVCSKDFSLINRKHTCKRCGRYVCGSCSKTKMIISSYDTKKEARICDICKVAPDAMVTDVDLDDEEAIAKFVKDRKDQEVPIPENEEMNDTKKTEEKEHVETEEDKQKRICNLVMKIGSDNFSTLGPHEDFGRTSDVEVPLSLDHIRENCMLNTDPMSRNVLVPALKLNLYPSSVSLAGGKASLDPLPGYCKSCLLCYDFREGDNYCGFCGTSDIEILPDVANCVPTALSWHLYQTEKMYWELLEYFSKDVGHELLESLQSKDMVLETIKRKKSRSSGTVGSRLVVSADVALFINVVSQLATLHREFLDEFHHRFQNWRVGKSSLNDHISIFVPFFQVYEDYLGYLPVAFDLLTSAEFVQLMDKKEGAKRWSPKVLWAPLQRLEQYAFLFEMMLASSNSEETDYKILESAVERMREKMKRFQHLLRDAGNKYEILIAQKEFVEGTTLTLSGRCLIKRGRVELIKCKQLSGMAKRKPMKNLSCYLFNDVWIEAVAQSSQGPLLSVFALTPLTEVVISPAADKVGDPKKVFKIVTQKGGEFWYSVSSAETKVEWEESFTRAIDEAFGKQIEDLHKPKEDDKLDNMQDSEHIGTSPSAALLLRGNSTGFPASKTALISGQGDVPNALAGIFANPNSQGHERSCSNCSNPIKKTHRFCVRCGTQAHRLVQAFSS